MSEGFREKPAAATGANGAAGTTVLSATREAESGAAFVEDPTSYDAVLLLGFGGPEGPEEVIPFLRNVTRGRDLPEERLEEVARHYRHFDGISPINEHNRQLKSALDEELRVRGMDLPVYWGNRNWIPYVSDALERIYGDGHCNVLVVTTSAFSSFSSCRQYREDVADALTATGLGGALFIDKVRQFFDHPGFVAPFVSSIESAARVLSADHPDLDLGREVEVLFSTHSIPVSDADRSGPPEMNLGRGGAYVAQHRAVAEVIMGRVGSLSQWQLVFQSRSGTPSVPWLEPDINDAIRELPGLGRRAVIIVPLGFVSDHMEVKWDLDAEAVQTAQKMGLLVVRTATPGTHPTYVAGLVDLIQERIEGASHSERPHETKLGPWFDVCRPACCGSSRLGFKPAVAGVVP